MGTHRISNLRSGPPSTGLTMQSKVLLIDGQFTVSMTALLNMFTTASADR